MVIKRSDKTHLNFILEFRLDALPRDTCWIKATSAFLSHIGVSSSAPRQSRGNISHFLYRNPQSTDIKDALCGFVPRGTRYIDSLSTDARRASTALIVPFIWPLRHKPDFIPSERVADEGRTQRSLSHLYLVSPVAWRSA